MLFYSNPDKNIEIEALGKTYQRHAIKTHYIQIGEDYIEVMRKHVSEIYEEGDIISISEKIIALCQNRVIHKKDIKVSFLANFLRRFVHMTPAGEAVGNPYKMQVAIMICGKWKVLYAAICAGIGKLFHKKGVFYKILGDEVAGIDGFCDDAFDDYMDLAILIPSQPDRVCNEIYEKLGIKSMIVDANDLNVEILGKADSIDFTKDQLKELIIDNPAGQAHEQTPIILIREKKEDNLNTENKEVIVES